MVELVPLVILIILVFVLEGSLGCRMYEIEKVA